MNNKKLLFLNLAVDDKDVSLGFANTWIEQFSLKFEKIDIITLNKSTDSVGKNNNVNIYGLVKSDKSSKLGKLLKIRKIIKDLTSTNKYDLCFSHMSPLLLLITKIFCTNTIPSVLWYTHPKPKELSKRTVLILALLFSNKVVTASKSSFPYNSGKVNVIGHAIDYELFLNKREKVINKEFVIISRISKSKNLEVAIDGFLNSKFKNNNIAVVGDAVTNEDENYKNKLTKKYSNNKNVTFLGKITHKELPNLISNYSYHINATPKGFYDKSVLEAISAGLFSFYSNEDYNKHFKKESNIYTKFELNKNSLSEVLDLVYEKEEKSILRIIKSSQLSVSKESIQSIYDRVIDVVEN